MINTLLVPDVHGREFWIGPVMESLKNPDCHIVFLGDYLSPYPNEHINTDRAFEVFNEILDIKKQYPDHITLLIGNHDCSIIGPTDICMCRHDTVNQARNQKLYMDNINLFDIGYQAVINNKRFLMTHAGISRGWLIDAMSDVPQEYIIDSLNSEFHKSFDDDVCYDRFWGKLNYISWSRGGYDDAGSCVWVDVREFLRVPKKDDYMGNSIQVFGHTQLNSDQLNIGNRYYDLDCRKCSYIDENGDICDYNTNLIIDPHPNTI